MEFPYIAASVGAALIILQMLLMMSVGTHRGKAGIGVGFGEDRNLERKIRRHGNLTENAAIFVVVLSFAEMFSGGGTIIAALGGLFVFARISHAIGFSSLAGSHSKDEGSRIFVFFRAVGALTTGLSGIALGAYLAFLLLAAQFPSF